MILPEIQLASLLIGFGIGFPVFFPLGVLSSYMYLRGKVTKDSITLERIISIVVIIMWVIFHIVAFFTSLQVEWVFNVAGFGALGHFVGLSIPLSIFNKK